MALPQQWTCLLILANSANVFFLVHPWFFVNDTTFSEWVETWRLSKLCIVFWTHFPSSFAHLGASVTNLLNLFTTERSSKETKLASQKTAWWRSHRHLLKSGDGHPQHTPWQLKCVCVCNYLWFMVMGHFSPPTGSEVYGSFYSLVMNLTLHLERYLSSHLILFATGKLTCGPNFLFAVL